MMQYVGIRKKGCREDMRWWNSEAKNVIERYKKTHKEVNNILPKA